MERPFRMASAALLTGILATAAVAMPPIDAYLAALIEAARPLDGGASAAFLSPERDPDERPTLVQKLEEIRPYWLDEDLSLEASLSAPQPFTLGGTMNSKRGGMIVWHGDIFAADFFVQHYAGSLRQPWFAWDGATLTLHPDGAAEQIFAHMRAAADGPTLRLYRGTTAYEALVFELWQSVDRGQELAGDWRDRLSTTLQAISSHAEEFYRAYEKGVTEGWATQADVDEMRMKWDRALARHRELMAGAAAATDRAAMAAYLHSSLVRLLTQSQFSGLFTTPSNERAALFSKGRVVEFAFSWDELEGLLRRGKLYVGFEKMYDGTAEDVQAEMGFMGSVGEADELAVTMLKAYRGSVAADSSTLFN